MDTHRPLSYALRALLFLNVLAILAVFYARALVVKLTRSIEKVVSVPLSVLLILLFAAHEALHRLKLKVSGSPRHTELLYHDIDALFWSGTSGSCLLVTNDLQSVTLRTHKTYDESSATVTSHEPQQQSTLIASPTPDLPVSMALSPKLTQKQLVKAGWNMLREHRDYKLNYASQTIELVSVST